LPARYRIGGHTWNGPAGLGFTHIDIAPPFQPDGSGNVFLADDFEKPHPLLGASGSADGAVADISAACRELELALLIDIVLDRVARGGAMARLRTALVSRTCHRDNTLDPRRARHEVDAADANFEDPAAGPQLIAWWIDRLVRLAQAGAEGFRLLGLDRVPGPGACNDCPRRAHGGRGLQIPRLDARYSTPARIASPARHRPRPRVRLTPWWDGRASLAR
jgi:starch synthase (maltosyl-transferring)